MMYKYTYFCKNGFYNCFLRVVMYRAYQAVVQNLTQPAFPTATTSPGQEFTSAGMSHTRFFASVPQ